MPEGKRWSRDELEILRSYVMAGKGSGAACLALPDRSIFSVRAKYAVLQTEIEEAAEAKVSRMAAQRDAAFQCAMAAAIRAGLEKMPIVAPPIGDFRPKVFHREPTHFGCSALNDI